MSSPNPTVYLKNLNDKVKKEELCSQIYALFSPYGHILDIVAKRGSQMKGQAFVVFRDIASATGAMRGLDGELFYDKKIHIEYARKQSHATLRLVDPNFVSPIFRIPGSTSAASSYPKSNNGVSKVTVSQAENEQKKRERGEEGANQMDEDEEEGERKRKKGDEEDADPDDMDMDEDEDEVGAHKASTSTPSHRPPSAVLFCQNLPLEVTDDVLGVLFQQYPGFSTTAVSHPNPTTKTKTANVRYDTADQAATARDALDGFMIKRGWKMKVDFV